MKYFIADTHFNHKKVVFGMHRRNQVGYFQTVEEHDEALLASINNLVGKKDQLYVLGDFGFKPSYYKSKINCKHVTLIRGNHDKHEVSTHAFGSYKDIVKVKLMNGVRCVLCHYPMIYWEGSHHGTYHLYGHCHGNRERHLNLFFPERRSLDITVDNLYNYLGLFGPISEGEIIYLLDRRKGHDDLTWYKKLQKERDEKHRNNTQG